MTLEERVAALEKEKTEDTKRLDWLQSHLDGEDLPKVYFQPTKWAGTIREQIDKCREEIPL